MVFQLQSAGVPAPQDPLGLCWARDTSLTPSTLMAYKIDLGLHPRLVSFWGQRHVRREGSIFIGGSVSNADV